MLDHIRDVTIPRCDVRISRVHVQVALRFVERDRRQTPRIDIGNQTIGGRVVAEARIAQIPAARGRARRVVGEVVERLMVVLEVRHRARILMLQRVLPRAAVPRPVDALVRQTVADRRVVLRRHHARIRRVGEGGVAVFGRTHAARLIRRRHRVDGVAVGSKRAVVDEFRRTVECGCRGVRRQLEPRAGRIIAVDHRDHFLRRTVVDVGIERRLRRDQKNVVHPRTAEGRHEEVVAQGVLLRETPQTQRVGGTAVVPHYQAT